eukprot:Polyplicarium_translucidae@DN3335_c0_g1_i6.p1
MEGFGIRINRKPPRISFSKKEKGGIIISNSVPLTNVDEDTIKSICHEYRISNAHFFFHCNATVDEIIDTIEGNRIYLPAIYVLNKIDQITIEELDVLSRFPHYVMISAHHEWNLDGLIEKIWEYLALTRIYTKPKGQIPDYSAPVVLKLDACTVGDFCKRIHKHLLSEFKYALIWGSSVKANPWKVGLAHQLKDEDVVQIVKRI